ncbi:MAG: flagellar filament capping protein FliD [Thermotogaceae bacterium]|nr:flagellar filament capping protein FliD [Thermotogaceae bacterium]RKX51166.1 MAG: flagellar hook protein FliD [Thermotoga sp.]
MDLSKIAQTINMRYYSLLGQFQVGGVVSGLDTASIVDQLMQIESQPLVELNERYEKYELMKKAYEELDNRLEEFRDFVFDLKLQRTFMVFSASSSDESTISAQASTSATPGTYYVKVLNTAFGTLLEGNDMVVTPPSSTATFGSLDYSYTPVDSTIRIYNEATQSYEEVNITTADTIDDIITKINTALSNLGMTGSASYDQTTGKLTITSDTNFFMVEVSGNLMSVFHLKESNVTYNGTNYVLQSTAPVSSLDPSTKTLQDIANYNSETIASGTVKINGVEITVDPTETLEDFLERINESSAGVTAWYDAYENKIYMRNNEGGPKAITLEDTDSTNVFGILGIENHTLTPGQEAHVQISTDGSTWMDLYTSNDSFEYNGITFTIKKASSDTITVRVERDVDQVISKIRDFVQKWNEIMDYINEKLTEEPVTDKSEDEMTEEEKMQGVLKNDSFLENIFDRLKSFITRKIEGDINYLWEIGITTGGLGTGYENMMKGHLELDEDTLRQVLSEDPEKVWRFFGNDEEGSEGFAVQLYNYLWDLTKFGGRIDQVAGVSGRLTREQRFLAIRIAEMIERLQRREAELWRKFTAMEEAIAYLQMQSSWLSQASGSTNK